MAVQLGWDNFIEGRISKVFLEAVKPALARKRYRMRLERWHNTLICTQFEFTHNNGSFATHMFTIKN